MNNVPIKGVPKSLKNTVYPFEYNNFIQLKKIVEAHEIGVIKMEVKRNFEPKNNFLQKVRKLANDKKIVLIVDFCSCARSSLLIGSRCDCLTLVRNKKRSALFLGVFKFKTSYFPIFNIWKQRCDSYESFDSSIYKKPV